MLKDDELDWRSAVESVAGLANGIDDPDTTDEVRVTLTEPVFVKFHGVWCVEAKDLKSYIQKSLDDPLAITSVLRRLEMEGLISPPRYTSSMGKTRRVRAIYGKVANEVFEDLWK